MRSNRLSTMVTAVAVGLVLFVAGTASAAEIKPSGWTWTNYARTLNDVSCATASSCVAVGDEGIVLRTTGDPSAPLAWSGIGGLVHPVELTGVTCNTDFCLAVSNTSAVTALFHSLVYRSTDGGVTWSAGVALPAAQGTITKTWSARTIACDPAPAGSRACYASGAGGGIWRSVDAGATWTPLDRAKGAPAYGQLDCPAAGVCAAVSGSASPDVAIVSGTKITAVAMPAGTGAGAGAIGCDTATNCTVTDGLAHFVSLTLPSGKWGTVKDFPPKIGVTSLTCPAKDTCLGLGTGVFARTTSLSSTTGGWKRRVNGDAIPFNLQALACAPGTATCVSVGKVASWFQSPDTGFTTAAINSVPSQDAVTCPAEFSGLCVGGGDKSIGVSRSGGALWRTPLAGVAHLDTVSVRCTGASTCTLLGKESTLLTTDLENFGGGLFPTTFDPAGTDALSCINDLICVGLTTSVTYTTLDGAKSLWTKSAFPPEKPSQITCLPGKTDPVTCLAVTMDFLIRGTMTVTDGRIHWDWVYTDVDPETPFTAVGCSAGGRCTAVGHAGEVYTSDDPALLEWTDRSVETNVVPANRTNFGSVTCPSDTVCLAGGEHGGKAVLVTTRDAWANYSEDEIGGLDSAAPMLKGFTCETVDRCLAVGDTAIVGVRTGT
jgi:hypothetical protein